MISIISNITEYSNFLSFVELILKLDTLVLILSDFSIDVWLVRVIRDYIFNLKYLIPHDVTSDTQTCSEDSKKEIFLLEYSTCKRRWRIITSSLAKDLEPE